MKWRETKEYRQWRVAVIRKDKHCQICKSITKRHAHHIKHAKYYPKLRFDVSNGICLCSDCHMVLHNKFAGGYRKKCEEKHLDRMKYVVEYLKNKKSIMYITK